MAAPSKKDSLIWRGLSLKELDLTYDHSQYAPNFLDIVGRYSSNSELTRNRLGNPTTISYGKTTFETLDLYACKNPKAPIHIYIHGGNWQQCSAKDFAFLAELFVNAGAHCLFPDFSNILQSNGDITPLAEQVKCAVSWAYKNAHTFNGDPEKIFISGHSSGAHLAAVALTADWSGYDGLPANIIKGGLLSGGIYDLAPIRLSTHYAEFKFTNEIEESLSPQRQVQFLNTPLILAYGSLESPEFMRHSQEFTTAIQQKNKPVELIVGQGYNHFDMIETLSNPYGILGRAALRQMGLS